MNIRFFPLDFDYKLKENKVVVYLYGKMEDGTNICVLQEHQPYFYARWKPSLEALSPSSSQPDSFPPEFQQLSLETSDGVARTTAVEEVERELLGIKSTFWKVYANYPKAVPVLAQQLESSGLEVYERDILFIHRYLRDHGITPMTLVEAQGEFVPDQNLRVPVFLAQQLQQFSQEAVQKLKILSLDIETYAEKKEISPVQNPILMIGLYGQDQSGLEFRKVLTWKRFQHELGYVEHVQDERELLERFRQIVIDYQPDIITGYNTDGFDFPYLKVRADKYNLILNLGRDHSELMAGTKSFRDGEAKIKGILHLDVFKFIRNIFGKDLKTDSYSLDAVSSELLGYKKHPVNLDELSHIWNHDPDKLVDFCIYNLHDAHLAFKLCELLLPAMIEFTKIIGLPTFDLIRMRFSRLVENYILKRAIEYKVLAPNKPGEYESGQRREESIQGAFVYEPTPGLYHNIVVFDFRSLYPTIITAHNIGPEGLRCPCCADTEHVPEQETYWFCQKEKKFLPTVLEELILRRADLKRLIKEEKALGHEIKMLEARSYALKLLANSFYGYLGFFGARWYCIECAASTTAYARNYIKKTIHQAQEKGFPVIYSDTDSCMLLLGEKILSQAFEFMNEVNFSLPGSMELEFQGSYPSGLFVALKSGEKGAKKKYALLSSDGQVKITGFETVRRNCSPIAKEIQEHVLQLALTEKVPEAVRYVRDMIKKMKQGEIPLEQLIIKTQITRELDSYSSIAPHVAIALRLQQQGESILPGTVVEYVIITA